MTHRLLLSDVLLLKNPGAHVLHLGWVVAVPLAFVYFPGGHFVWAAQKLLFALFDILLLKNPLAQSSHLGWANVAFALVYLPGGHWTFLAGVQVSVLVLLFDVEALKNPGAHASHSG